MREQGIMTHSQVCLEARKRIKDIKLNIVKKWILEKPKLDFEIRKGRDLYQLIKRISLLNGVEFATVARFIPGNFDKWRIYKSKGRSPKLETLQTISQVFKIGIKVGFDNGKIHPDFWVDGKAMNFSEYLASENKRKELEDGR